MQMYQEPRFTGADPPNSARLLMVLGCGASERRRPESFGATQSSAVVRGDAARSRYTPAPSEDGPHQDAPRPDSWWSWGGRRFLMSEVLLYGLP